MVSSVDVGGFFAGRFRLDAKLGVGAVGRVMTAVDTRTGVRVALKVLHKNRSGDAEVITRFQREAELLRELRHPGIVKLVDFGQSKEEGWWLAMELLEGRTMKDHLATQGSFTPRDAWPIVATICDALAYAHSKQVLHRELLMALTAQLQVAEHIFTGHCEQARHIVNEPAVGRIDQC